MATTVVSINFTPILPHGHRFIFLGGFSDSVQVAIENFYCVVLYSIPSSLATTILCVD